MRRRCRACGRPGPSRAGSGGPGASLCTGARRSTRAKPIAGAPESAAHARRLQRAGPRARPPPRSRSSPSPPPPAAARWASCAPRGATSSPLIAAVCGRALVPRQATLLPFIGSDGQALDRGLAIHFPAPHSYTGEDVLELQAHGGPVLLQLLLARCLQAQPGLRLAAPGEFTERAFLNDKIDLAQAEAVADLIDASTEAAARSAARSLAGAFSAEVTQLSRAHRAPAHAGRGDAGLPRRRDRLPRTGRCARPARRAAGHGGGGAGARAPGRAAARRPARGAGRPAQRRQELAAQRAGRRRAGHRHAHCPAPRATRSPRRSRSKACRCT